MQRNSHPGSLMRQLRQRARDVTLALKLLRVVSAYVSVRLSHPSSLILSGFHIASDSAQCHMGMESLSGVSARAVRSRRATVLLQETSQVLVL